MPNLPFHRSTTFAAMLGLLATTACATEPNVARLDVHPPRVVLTSARDVVQLVVTGLDGAASPVVDLTHAARYATRPVGIVEIVAGAVRPLRSGQAEIVVQYGALSHVIPVTVAPSVAEPGRVSLQFDVLPALTKHSCNSGACHGSPTGKGGFRLSLRAFDVTLDTETLTREVYGRRTNPFEPDESLLLLKPTMHVAHGGGGRLRRTDVAYGVLRDWIAEGCRPDPAPVGTLVGLEVFPTSRLLRAPAREQQVAVRAKFADGSTRDVTQLADYVSSEELVAKVSPTGRVQATGRGETTLIVRYLDQVAVAPLTFLEDVPGFAWPNPPAANFIDELVFEKLQLLQIPPSDLCTDAEFVRRVHLDVIGALPTVAESQAFLADAAPDKRSRLVDRLLDRAEYADFWALKRADLLQLKGSKLSSPGVHKFWNWIVQGVRDDQPFDQFARELLTARGSTFENPPANFFRASVDPNSCSETTAQLFLGIRIQCAKCHNHPFESWTQDTYYGLGAVFSRVQRKETRRDDEQIVWLAPTGEVVQPRTQQVMPPRAPYVGDLVVGPDGDRRVPFAAWLTQPGNPFFARVAVNRIWGHLFGQGIVEPVDDFRESNPPSHPKLLDALATEFTRLGYRQRPLLRTILTSRLYQLSSRTHELNAADRKYFSHAIARRLTAEQLLDAISQVTGVAERFPGLPAGTRATQLPSPDVGNDFLAAFGQPNRNTACQCERSNEMQLSQALMIGAGQNPLVAKLQHPQGRIAQLAADGSTALPARLAAAGTPTKNGLQLWLRADAAAERADGTAAEEGDAVATWRDQTDGRRDVGQAEASSQPRFLARGLAGFPALEFDGQHDFLHNTQANLVKSGGARTVFVVGRASPTSPGGSLFTFRRSTRGQTIFALQQIALQGTHYVYSDGLHGDGNSTIDAAHLDTLRQPFVTTALSAGAGNKLQIHMNGTPVAVTQPGGVYAETGADGFTIGNREDYAGMLWQGVIAEVLVYDRVLTSGELRQTGGYLATKYELPGDYPRHPVKIERTASTADAEIVRDAYLAAFSRPPTDEELATAVAYLTAAESRRDALEDLYWAILNSKEFLFQH